MYPVYIGRHALAEKRLKEELEHNPEFRLFMEVNRGFLAILRNADYCNGIEMFSPIIRAAWWTSSGFEALSQSNSRTSSKIPCTTGCGGMRN